MSDIKTHKGHPVDVHFENNSLEQVNRYTEQLNAIRQRCPVAWSDGHWSPKDTGFWLVTSYKRVREAAMNWQLFTTEQGANPVQQDLEVFRMIPLETDPPLHTNVRSRLAHFFSASSLNQYDEEIRKIINEVLDECVVASPADFARKFSYVVPSRVFFEIFLRKGRKDSSWILELVQNMIAHPEMALEVAPKLLHWCEEVLEEHRKRGITDDIIGVVAHMGNEPDFKLDEKQRVEILNLLLLGGFETTGNGISAMVHTMATNPVIRAKLAGADANTVKRAVDEFLRHSSPVTAAGRTLTADTDAFGCPMRKGERVTLSWTAANHDPEAYPNPDVLDLERNASQHVAFGHAHHKCIGMHLANREMRLVIEEICKLRTFELVPGTEVTYRTGVQRGIVSLPVVCAR